VGEDLCPQPQCHQVSIGKGGQPIVRRDLLHPPMLPIGGGVSPTAHALPGLYALTQIHWSLVSPIVIRAPCDAATTA
jgi:hypothetical protein